MAGELPTEEVVSEASGEEAHGFRAGIDAARTLTQQPSHDTPDGILSTIGKEPSDAFKLGFKSGFWMEVGRSWATHHNRAWERAPKPTNGDWRLEFANSFSKEVLEGLTELKQEMVSEWQEGVDNAE